MGARSMGVGYNSSCLFDEWGITSNIAGLAEIKNITTAVSYNSYPRSSFFNRSAALIIVPSSMGVIGGSIFRFGDEVYNEQIISAGFANQFGLASLGIKANYIQYTAEGFGSRGVFTLGIGGIAKLTPNILIGSYITNINQPKIVKEDEPEIIPTRMNLGMCYRPAETISILTEIEKDLDNDAIFKAGFEYKVRKKFTIRSGVNLNPDAGFAGFGFVQRKFVLDYALEYHTVLGINHQLSIAFKPKMQ
jgi:hypothetical protein